MKKTLSERVKEYFAHPGVNASLLKDIESNINGSRKKYSPATYFDIGNVGECLFLYPSLFDEFYLVVNTPIKKESKAYKVAETLFKQFGHQLRSISQIEEAEINNAFIECTYLVKSKNKKALAIKNCEPIYTELLKSAGKCVIDSKTFNIAKKAAVNLKALLKTFEEDTFYHKKLVQFPVYVAGRKILLDLMYVDTKNKILYPIDCKLTSSRSTSFNYDHEKLKMYIQAGFYTDTLSLKYKDYKVKPFRFIVESYTMPGQPLFFEYNPVLLKQARDGYVNKLGIEKMGWKELLEKYQKHVEAGQFTQELDEYIRPLSL